MTSEREVRLYIKALSFAIKMEEDSTVFYENASEIVGESNARRIFHELKAEEIRHANILMDFRTRLSATIKLDPENATLGSIMQIEMSSFLLPHELNEGTSIKDALTLAIKREEKAADLFHNLANITANDGLSALYGRLRREEEKHLALLEEVYEKVIGQKD